MFQHLTVLVFLCFGLVQTITAEPVVADLTQQQVLNREVSFEPLPKDVDLSFGTMNLRDDCADSDYRPNQMQIFPRPVLRVPTPLAIINTGLKIWKVIEQNRPVYHSKSAVAHAYPSGVDCWDQLQGWQPPKGIVITEKFKNLFNVTVAEFKFLLLFQYGGNIDGNGRYLANISFQNISRKVLIGFKLNASAEVLDVLNVGTRENPLAYALMKLDWELGSVAKLEGQGYVFSMDGNGNIEQLE